MRENLVLGTANVLLQSKWARGEDISYMIAAALPQLNNSFQKKPWT